MLPIAIGMEDYLNFNHTKDIDKLNENDIQSFLRHLVMESNVSTSYQNQAIITDSVIEA